MSIYEKEQEELPLEQREDPAAQPHCMSES